MFLVLLSNFTIMYYKANEYNKIRSSVQLLIGVEKAASIMLKGSEVWGHALVHLTVNLGLGQRVARYIR